MFALHIALQGCLRGSDVQYGINADTGGHIRYLLGMVEASERIAKLERIVIATRAFDSKHGSEYAAPRERVSSKTEIVRFATPNPDYLTKEELWSEVPAYAESLIEWIGAQPAPPDIIHAHYADAGVVAGIVRERLGIPYTFVAHSLGRVKMDAFRDNAGSENPDSMESLERRIDIEERAIRGAALIVASSRDEAEFQYSQYKNYDPGRIRIVPPGAELAAFRGAPPRLQVDRLINRFLTHPEKPALIAIARPVAKKNLAMLVKAYGESPQLQEMANLILIAGNRSDISDLEPEISNSLSEILRLIDLYDLYGKIAYPKVHLPSDVPAIYGYAQYRRGIFINPALNEPFGLTLLEAAAVGIPIIATDSGGPNDIVEICRNGELVDPSSPDDIAQAAIRILADPALWDSYAAAGARAVKRFDWRSHAKRYLRLAEAVTGSEGIGVRQPRELLVSDIDNTLLGSRDALTEFSEWLAGEPEMAFAIASGRSFHSAMSVLEQEDAPLPDIMITSVGSEIYYRAENGPEYRADPEWAEWIAEGWDRAGILAALQELPGIRPQSPLEQRRFKLSYLSPANPDAAATIAERLIAAGLQATVMGSHARYIDILPPRASKGTAVEFVRKRLGLVTRQVYVAGDSGNDVEMLRLLPNAIVVGNFCDQLRSRPELDHCHFAPRRYARGILDGVAYFRGTQDGQALSVA